jgi:dipeptidyl aminopeptidase/acylaminoacyl peptidase
MNKRDPRLFDVYKVNLASGELALDTENPGDVSGWLADNDMKVRAAQSVLPDGSIDIKVKKESASPWSLLEHWGADDAGGHLVAFTPDNKGVYLLSSIDANALRLMEHSLETGKIKEIAADKDYDISEVLIHPKTHVLLAVQFMRARGEWFFLDKSLEPDFQALRKLQDGDVSITSYTNDFGRWIVEFVNDDKPAHCYIYDRMGKKAVFLFSTRPEIETFTLSRMTPVSFKARDGMTIHGYLTLPAGLAPRNLPLVINVHGGPWYRDHWGFNREVQWLANRGYAVLQINFRGSTGYGKTFLNAGNREWGRKMHYDILDGKQWAIKEGYADPGRVCIYGGSYGGYATLAGLAFTPDEFTCGVDIVGPSNLITLLNSFPPYWSTMKSMFERRVGKLSEEEFLKSCSPLFSAQKIKSPLLIGQGANDPRVKQQESDQIVSAMRKNGKDVEYLVFPDEGHGFARPENNMKFYAAAEAFLAKYLGGRLEPPSGKEQFDDLKK